MKKEFTQEYLKECFNYDESTGVITWHNRPLKHFTDERSHKIWNTRYANTIAGYKSKVNKSDLYYWRMSLDNHSYSAHVLIWVWIYGSYTPLIDHIDGDGLNNKKDNLRELSVSKNVRKGKIQKNNTSGFKGVSYRSDTNKWSVRLKVNGFYKSFGSYDDLDYASKIYSTAISIITGENFTNVEPFNNDSDEYKFIENKIK